MRSRFDAQLENLNNELVNMGAMIETAIGNAVKALMHKDVELAKKAISYDTEIDHKEREIEGDCLKLLLQQQPVAGDLRLISSALKMITDMERVGDHASDISEIVVMLKDKPYQAKLKQIPKMAEETIKMLNDCVDAFVRKDLDLAMDVIKRDDVVDDLFDEEKNSLLSVIRENADNGEEALDLLMIAKYFERIGDHATNIAEWVVFSITGEHKEDNM
ncbi:MAG TPA: phosphate signaling complex protein PhoU [Candidatus Caccomorpha excrementavium]|nr:phosphate signaling complex protein PhoU [Candidatus Caccomorpha excrementavium]